MDEKYIPLTFFLKVSRKDNEPRERVMLIGRDEKGKEYAFMFEDFNEEMQDLTVCDMPTKSEKLG